MNSDARFFCLECSNQITQKEKSKIVPYKSVGHSIEHINQKLTRTVACTSPAAKMGFLTIVRKLRQKEQEMKIVIFGLDNAGKTTIVKKFNGEPTDTIAPTLGFDIKTLEYRGYNLNIWDIGGQQTIRSYWRNYFEATDGLVWVVDSADRGRLADCREELDRLLSEERLAGLFI